MAGIMPLKKIDNRIRTLIDNGVAWRYRSLFVVVGDHGRDQVGVCCYAPTTRHRLNSSTGRHFASHDVQSCSEGSSYCFVVLQERVGLQQVRFYVQQSVKLLLTQHESV